MATRVSDETVLRIATLAAPLEARKLRRNSVRWHDFRRIAAATLAVAAGKPTQEEGDALLNSI